MKRSVNDVISMVRSARRQYRPGTGTVYDRLLRQAGADSIWLTEELRSHCGVETISADQVTPDFTALNPATAAAWRCVVLRSSHHDHLLLGAEDPWDEALLNKAASHINRPLVPTAVTFVDLCRWIGRDGAPAVLDDSAVDDVAVDAGPSVEPDPHIEATRFLDKVIGDLMSAGTTELHLEAERDGVAVRLRRDGQMSQVDRLDGAQAAGDVLAQLKSLAHLDVSERRLVQEGRLRIRQHETVRELRVAVLPSAHGEDMFLRLVDSVRPLTLQPGPQLEMLGFDDPVVESMRRLATRPGGLVVIAGPAGSGKTSTAHALMAHACAKPSKTFTIEDPIEYELPGARQISIDEGRGLSAMKALQAALRQGPDRLLIGEMREAEVAVSAVQIALTGRAVVTTMQARDLVDVVARARHFGVDSFAFMAALEAVVVQNLMRRLCGRCAATREATPQEREWLAALAIDPPNRLPKAVGCAHCGGTGYRGRLVVAELHPIDDRLRDEVLRDPGLSALRRTHHSPAAGSNAARAARYVLGGDTSIDEVARLFGSR
jgi:general secretion pathway protein E